MIREHRCEENPVLFRSGRDRALTIPYVTRNMIGSTGSRVLHRPLEAARLSGKWLFGRIPVTGYPVFRELAEWNRGSASV